MIRNGLSSAARFFLRYFKMRVWVRLSCAVGNVFNDFYRQLLQSFELLFFMKVVELSASEAGLIILIGEIADALFSPITGYLGDLVNLPFLSKRIGRRKSWHLLATVFMAVALPLLFNRCFLCAGNHQSWLPLFYFGFFSALVNICFNMVEINHMAFITAVAESVEEFTILGALRTVFRFLSGIYIYAIAWSLLGQDNAAALGPDSLSDFAYLSWIATGTGVLFVIVFLIGSTKEHQKRLRRRSRLSGILNTPGIFVTTPLGSENAGSHQDSLAHRFVDMIMASSQLENYKQEMNDWEESQSRELHNRKKSVLQKFVAAIFSEGDNYIVHARYNPVFEEETKDPEREDTKKRMVVEVQQLDRERKKSLMMRVFDGLLSRLGHEEEEQPKLTVGIEHQVSADNEHERYLADKEYCRHEENETFREEDTWKMHNNNKAVDEEAGDGIEEKFPGTLETSILSKRKQRKHAIVMTSVNGRNSVLNLGSEYDTSDDSEKENFIRTTVKNQKKSVTFDEPGLSDIPSMDEGTQKKLSLEDLPKDGTILSESAQGYLAQDCAEDNTRESAVLDDNPAPHSFPVLSEILPTKRKRPKRIKDWLRDPNLYRVAIIFTSSRLAQNAVYNYLPLFLTERLLFAKEAIAYFPLILLISATFSSLFCNSLNRKIGSKWSYLLAGSLVMGCSVWSYFQTVSTKQSAYAVMVIMGSGLSVMDVMALVFITEVIGENKETSGSVFAIITVIARLSGGTFIIGIQEFYPRERISSNEAVGNYVRHVFALAPGILTLIGSLLVLLFQPSRAHSKSKGFQDAEAQADQSSLDIQVPQHPRQSEATPDVRHDENQTSFIATVHSYPEDTKL